jgi:hypothetical protein
MDGRLWIDVRKNHPMDALVLMSWRLLVGVVHYCESNNRQGIIICAAIYYLLMCRQKASRKGWRCRELLFIHEDTSNSIIQLRGCSTF